MQDYVGVIHVIFLRPLIHCRTTFPAGCPCDSLVRRTCAPGSWLTSTLWAVCRQAGRWHDRSTVETGYPFGAGEPPTARDCYPATPLTSERPRRPITAHTPLLSTSLQPSSDACPCAPSKLPGPAVIVAAQLGLAACMATNGPGGPKLLRH